MTLNQHFDERGLTFFEMLMVLFILSILLLLPILSFPSLVDRKILCRSPAFVFYCHWKFYFVFVHRDNARKRLW